MTVETYFEYGEKEVNHLKARDKRLAGVIEAVGPIKRAVIPDLFTALVNSIVGQQISSKAHATVWARVTGRFAVDPQTLHAASVEDIQACGMSMRKAGYIKEIARAAVSGLDLEGLAALPDDEVCSRLTALPGIGLWTAQMLLIFSMQRPDVLSFGDYGIRKGLRMVYRHREITPQLFEKYKRRYSPFASVASLYLWEVAGGALPELNDPKPKGK